MKISTKQVTFSLVAFIFFLVACTNKQAAPVSQAQKPVSQVQKPLSQAERPPASIPLSGPNLELGNANWVAGLHAKTEWIWSAHLIPQGFENNLGKFFIHIPAVFKSSLTSQPR